MDGVSVCMKQNGVFRRLISLALLLSLVLSLMPLEALAASAAQQAGSRMGYIVINNSTKNRVVNFRPRPGSTDYLDQLPEYRVVEILEEVTYSKALWYKAKPWGSNVTGYLMGEFVHPMTDAELADWRTGGQQIYRPGQAPAAASPTPAPGGQTSTPPPASAALGYLRTVVDKVNLRQTPGGTILNERNQIPLGTVLAYYGVTQFDEYDWAQVNYNGQTGYVRSDCYKRCDAAGNILSNDTVPINSYGTYGRTTADNVFFRKSMNVNGDFWARLPMNWVLEILGSETRGNTLWYKVRGGIPNNPSRTYTGYVHGNFFTVIQNAATDPAPVPSVESNYGLITLDAINLRETAGGTPITALRANTVVNIYAKPAGNTANDWYIIEVNGIYGFVPATALRVLSQAELSNYVLPPAPVPRTSPSPVPGGTGYVKTVLTNVNIRKTPGGTVLTPRNQDKIPVNTVMAYSAGPVQADNYSWVLVTYNGITGYVRSDCWTYCDASGTPSSAPTGAPVTVPSPAPGPNNVPVGYIRLIKGGVNVRSNPWQQSLGRLARDTLLPYYSTVFYNGSELWYQVYAAELNAYGYVLGSMAQLVNGSGNPVQPSPTPTQGQTTATGYVATTASSVWLRLTPEVNAATAGQVKQKGTVLPLTGAPVSNGSFTWYPVITAEGVRAYLRGDFVFQLADWQLDIYNRTGSVPSPTPGAASPRPGNSSYVTVTTDKVWVREKASTKAGTLGQVNRGTVLPFTKTVKSGQSTWYQVNYGGRTAYILGNFVRVLTNAEYDAYRGSPTPVPAATSTAYTNPTLTNLSDLALTTADKVIIRQTGEMTGRELTTVRSAGTKLTYLGKYTVPTATNPYYWFNIRYGNISGWMRGDLVRVLTADEKKAYETTQNPDAPKEASYRTLSKNSTGDDVTALQQKLVQKGYLTADQVSGVYLTSTENAVIAFQKANGLTVDGIAGEKTQHMLFGTVPVGTYDGSSVEAILYPVEKIDWYSGGIQSIFGVGTVAVVTDVYTGISFRAQRLYGDNHADCEPLTKEDTAAYCQIFGVNNAQEIADREDALQSWRRRPLWVTVGGRTFAASLYGVPHNFSGDRIADNDFRGQFCIHFTNSRTHNTNHVDVDASYNGWFGAVSAIDYAYTHSKSGNK